MIHSGCVVIQNGSARGYNSFLVDKRDKMVAQRGFVVQQSNNGADESTEMALQKTCEVQQSVNCVCICGYVVIHSGCVVIQNGNARGHSCVVQISFSLLRLH